MKQEKFNGIRLKEAMQLREKKMTELARETGISKQSLSLYANEANTPPAENVFKIAKALSFPYQFFMTEPSQVIRTGKTYFRSQASTTKRARVAASQKTKYVAYLYEILLSKIDFPQLNLPDTRMYDFEENFQDVDSDEAVSKIERLAEYVRDYWGLGNGPIDNLQYLLESNGIVVTGFKNEDSSIDAYSQQINVNSEDIYVVVLAIGKKPLERLRFDMAHELGHLLMHRWSIEDTEGEVSKDEFNAREKQANIFASAFLLPRKSFGMAVSAYPTAIDYYRELKKKWKVSMQAMMYRSRQMGIITANQFQYMMRQISKKGWRLKEPGDVPGQLRDNLFQGAIDLLIDGGYMSKEAILDEFANEGIIFRIEDLERFMCLRKGTLVSEKKQFKFPVLHVKNEFDKA